MKVVTASTVWLAVALVALPALVRAEPPPPSAPKGASPPVFVEPGTQIFEPQPEAPEGSCIGGDCLEGRLPRAAPLPRPRKASRAGYRASIFGVVAAGLVLGGAIAIAAADQRESEKVTRGLWLGTMTLSPPIVSLIAWRARKQGHAPGWPGGRRLGWVSYASAIAGGVLGFVGALRDESTPGWLTVGTGVFGTLSLLPLALDALMSGRGSGIAPARAQQGPRLSGLGVRF